MKVNQWTLGLAAAGAIAFGAVCSMIASKDPPAEMAASVSQTEIIAKDINKTLAENTSPPRISAVASKNDANGMIAGFDSAALVGKEVAFTGPQLAAGVISFGSVAYTHTATDAHKMHVLAIPISVPAIAAG